MKKFGVLEFHLIEDFSSETKLDLQQIQVNQTGTRNANHRISEPTDEECASRNDIWRRANVGLDETVT